MPYFLEVHHGVGQDKMGRHFLSALLCLLPFCVFTRNTWFIYAVTGILLVTWVGHTVRNGISWSWEYASGGLLLVYGTLQWCNVRASQISLSDSWKLVLRDYNQYLPSGIATLEPSVTTSLCLVLSVLLVVILMRHSHRPHIYAYWTGLVLSGVMISLLGMVQELNELGIYGLIDLPSGYHPFGTFTYKNHAVAFLNLTWITGLVQLLRAKSHSRPLWGWILALVIISCGVFTTNSRAGTLVQVCLWTVLAYIWFRKRLRCSHYIFIGTCLLTLFVVWWFHPGGVRLRQGEGWDNQARTTVAFQTVYMGYDYLPFGVGLGQFSYQFPKYQAQVQVTKSTWWDSEHWVFWEYAHCEWAQWFAELGIFGILWLIGTCTCLWHTWGYTSIPLRAGLIGISIWCFHTLVDFPLHNLPVLLTFSAIIAGLWNISKKTDKDCACIPCNNRMLKLCVIIASKKYPV